MDATTFDGISRNLGSVSTRRSMIRLLGGAATLGVSGFLAAQEATRGKGRGQRNGDDREQVSAQGKGKKITICYQGKTKLIKKSKLGNFPGATRGACPDGGNPGGNPGGEPQPVMCTRWILSGGPNQTDKMFSDDDLYFFNRSQGGTGILVDDDHKTNWHAPVVFDARVGDRIGIVGYDSGGCRTISPIWLHCLATGASRQVYAGFNGAHCNYTAGTFVNQEFLI